jgi:hypothetical protein
MSIFQDVKALITAYKVLGQLKEAQMKSGYQTTEFWLTLVGTVGTAWAGLGSLIPATLAAQLIAGLVIAYAIVRGLIKVAAMITPLTATTKDDALVTGLSQILDKIDQVFGKPNGGTGTPS